MHGKPLPDYLMLTVALPGEVGFHIWKSPIYLALIGVYAASRQWTITLWLLGVSGLLYV